MKHRYKKKAFEHWQAVAPSQKMALEVAAHSVLAGLAQSFHAVGLVENLGFAMVVSLLAVLLQVV